MPEIALRPETDADLGFLKALYASSREREMAMLTTWASEEKRAFLDSQFTSQRTHFRQHYEGARFDIVERAGKPIGRLYVASLRSELALMDITLLPAERNAGIGTKLCEQVIAEAARLGKIVSLHVEDENPARRLYDRLGFVEIAAVTFYKRMHWAPPGLEALGDRVAAEAQARLGP